MQIADGDSVATGEPLESRAIGGNLFPPRVIKAPKGKESSEISVGSYGAEIDLSSAEFKCPCQCLNVMAAEERIAALERQVANLTKEVQKGADIESVRRIFHIYGYYFDKSLYHKVTSCFADHRETKVYWMGGVWKTLEGVKRIYMKSFADGLTAGHWGPSYGLLLDHHMMQDVITISEDGKRAKVPSLYTRFIVGSPSCIYPMRTAHRRTRRGSEECQSSFHQFLGRYPLPLEY